MALKDNKLFRWITIPVCVALCFVGRFIPLGSLSSDASGVIFIFVTCLFLWLTIGIDWPSILCITALGFLNGVGFKSAFTGSFGNFTFIFLLFTFICTYSLSKTSLIKRVALAFVNNKLAKNSGYWFVVLFLTAVLVLGLFISPSVLFVIILPILEEIFKITGIDKEDKIGKVLMMGLGFTVSISSGMTPIAHVFPILAMSAASITGFPPLYLAIAMPTGILLFITMLLILLLVLRPDVSKLKNVDVAPLKESLADVTASDIITVVVFGLVIILWIVPSFIEKLLPDVYAIINGYTTAMPPLVGTLILCIIRVKNKPVLNVVDALKNGVPWPALLMCAATILLGSCLTSNDIGIKQFVSEGMTGILTGLPWIVILIVFAVWAAVQTNLASNMVTATLVSSVAATVIASSIGLDMVVVVSIIGMLASFAFATPPSMPHIAIVAGSKYCNAKDVLIYGGILMFASIVIAVAVAALYTICL